MIVLSVVRALSYQSDVWHPFFALLSSEAVVTIYISIMMANSLHYSCIRPVPMYIVCVFVPVCYSVVIYILQVLSTHKLMLVTYEEFENEVS